jgi:hypothetical protein
MTFANMALGYASRMLLVAHAGWHASEESPSGTREWS